MIKHQPQRARIFQLANEAARTAMESVVDVARRTQTDILVFRDGQTTRLNPNDVSAPGEAPSTDALKNPTDD